ncbi:hypothetical protein ACE6H2_014782 [Prunus campanulata]
MNQQFYNLGSVDYTKNVPHKTSLAEDFLRHEKVKKALGVNGLLVFEECSDLVGDILHEDVMSRFWFQGLVSGLESLEGG